MRHLDDHTLDTLRQVCRDEGLRLTQQRLAVFRAVFTASDHPTAEMIHGRVRQEAPTMSLDTVYRTLALLERHGLIHRVLDPGKGDRFDPVTDGHAHAVCRRCGQVADLGLASLQAAPAQEIEAWGRVERRHVICFGICKACLAGPGK